MPELKYKPWEEFAEHIVDPPSPASRSVPTWFRKMEPIINKDNAHRNPDKSANKTMKVCMPIVDSLTSGYMVTLPCDVAFVDPNKYGGQRILWDVSWKVVDTHSAGQTSGFPMYDNFEPNAFKWNIPWITQSPPGYSMLYTHPLNRFDLPFITMSGIVDTDRYEVPVNFPFFVRSDFIGKIEKGTPIAQMIPIKREKWTSSRHPYERKNAFLYDSLRSVVDASYRLRWWNKKSYD